MSELPNGWISTTLKECCEIIPGQSPPGDTYNEVGNGLPFYQGKAEFTDLYPKPRKWCTRPSKLAVPGDVLISIRAPVGPTNLANETCCIGRGLAALRPRTGISTKFVLYEMRATEANLAGVATGSTFSAVSSQQLREHSFVLAPSAEQDRIVAEIEKQFSRLDAATAALKQVQANLKRYRASVLKAACEGRLVPTEAELARKEGRDYEPADKLLERILRERRARWEADTLAKMIASGKPPKDGQWKQKYKEPSAPDTAKLPELPEGWCWAIADQLCSQITDGEHIQPPYTQTGRPLLSAKHVQEGYVDFRDFGLIAEDDFVKARTRCAPKENDVLIVSVGATTGRAGIVRQEEHFAIVRSVLLLRPLINPMYLLTWVQSPRCRDWIGYASGSTAQAHFYINDAKRMPVAIAPHDEQERIVNERDRMLSGSELVWSAAFKGLRRSEALRSVVLRAAFSGKLVRQDPADEPAAVLLESIRAERAPSGSKTPSRSRSRELAHA